MATNHRISSDGNDRYHGAVKATELRSPRHEHSKAHAGSGEEATKPRLKLYDGFEKGFMLINGDGRPHQPRDKIDGNDHRHGNDHTHGKTDRYDHGNSFDRRHLSGYNPHNQGVKLFGYGSITVSHGDFDDKTQTYQITKVTVTHSAIFSGSHLGGGKKSLEAHQNFIKAALNFIQNPGEQAYKSLNDSMLNLMDPRFTPAVKGGAAQVKTREVNGITMAKISMEVTPAPTKTLEEAREDLKKAYSTKRDGEKDIAAIRAEAYTNYVRALSEKFKSEGKISHTNDTPTTPVFKSTVIYVVNVKQVNLSSLHELKKPVFGHSPKGRLNIKGHHNFWNGFRQSHKSYVDMLKHDHKKTHIDKDFKSSKDTEPRHHYRHSEERRTETANHSHHNKAQAHRH